MVLGQFQDVMLIQPSLSAPLYRAVQIYPGSPWENGYNERFNGTLRHDVLNTEWFTSIDQAQIVINMWLKQ